MNSKSETRFRVGDRVVDPRFRGRGVVVNWEAHNGFIGVRFDDYDDYVNVHGFHAMDPDELVREQVYDSPLYKALS